ncbi:MAG: DUF1573 domain-containing protein [Planctomycetota bacterium]
MMRSLSSVCAKGPGGALALLAVSMWLGVVTSSPAWAQGQGGAPAPPSAEKPPEPTAPAEAAPKPPAEPPAPLPPPGGSEAGEAETAGPRVVIAEPEKDFGEFWAGAELAHSFAVKNTGTQTLEIVQVRASCGCTSTGYDKQIEPGAEGKINVKVKTANFNGRFSKSVTVTTNDPNSSTITLKLAGVAKPYVTVEPRNVAFTQVEPDQVLQKTVKIANNSPDPMTLTLEEQQIVPFSATLTETEPGKSFELQITGNPPYQPRLNKATFHLKTNVAATPQIDVACTANVPPRLEMLPPSIVLRTSEGRQTKQTVRFVNNGKTDVTVTGAETDDPNIAVALRERTPGKNYDIDLVFPQSYVMAETGVDLLVRTDDPEVPSLTVPIAPAPVNKPKPKPGESLVGRPAPKVAIESVEGKTVAVGEPSNEILVLEFYASWCPFCKRSLPEVEKLHQKYKDQGVRLIAVSQDERSGAKARTEEQIAEHFKDLNLTMERALDPEQKWGKHYFAQSYPTMYLIGKNGVVEAAHFGAIRDLVEVVSKDLDELLAGKSPSASRSSAAAPAASAAAQVTPAPVDLRAAEKSAGPNQP